MKNKQNFLKYNSIIISIESLIKGQLATIFIAIIKQNITLKVQRHSPQLFMFIVSCFSLE